MDGPNLYAYVMQNPWTSFDPEGLYGWEAFKTDSTTVMHFGVGSLVGLTEGLSGVAERSRPPSVADYYGRTFGRGMAVSVGSMLIGNGTGTAASGVVEIAGGVAATAGSGGALVLPGGAAVADGGIKILAGGLQIAVGAIVVNNAINLPPVPAPTSSQKEVESENREAAKGGAYENVPANGGEVHHAPADSVSPLSTGKGPGWQMETADHRQTASWGSSKEAKAYRAQQKTLIEQGKFKEAQQMDIDDTRAKFGNKYDEGIRQAQEYTNTIDPKKLEPKK